MKKILITAMFAVLSLTTFAGEWYSLPSINIKVNEYEWTGWQDCKPGPIIMLFEYEKKQMTIYSKEPQVLNYSVLTEKRKQGYNYFYGYATDTNYTTVLLELYSYDDGTEFICISYPDIQYMYVVKKVEK